jgi:hypothetical protein
MTTLANKLRLTTLQERLGLLERQYKSLSTSLLTETNPATRVQNQLAADLVLAEIEQVEATMQRLGAPPADANRAYLQWQKDIHRIDFDVPEQLLQSQLWQPFRARQCAALVLFPDSYRKCGDLLLRRVRDELTNRPDFLPLPVGFRYGVPPTPEGFLDALAGHLNTTIAGLDRAAASVAVTEALIGSLSTASVRLIELEIKSGARFRSQTCELLQWLAGSFWPPFVQALAAAPNRSLVKVVLSVLLDDDGLLDTLDATLRCAGAFHSERFFELTLSNWAVADIEVWLLTYSPLPGLWPEADVRASAAELHQQGGHGEPRQVRVRLETILNEIQERV